jgi:histidinol-phosphate aminotransferase
LSVRPSLLYYRRDSYVVPAGDRDGGVVPSRHQPAVGGADDGTIDCSSGYFRAAVAPVLEAALRRIDPASLARYPEVHHDTLLKPALLERFRPERIGADQLFLGHGSFNLVERVIHELLRADEMLGVGPQFNEVPSEFREAGGVYRSIPLADDGARLPLDELEAALAGHPVSVLYVDNPNNPLGAFYPQADLDRLARACARKGAALLVDEAWGDYVPDSESAIHLVSRHPNVLVVRSFSKALGLAGERVGYMFASEPLARYYRQVDVPFEPGIVAATLARAVLDAPGVLDEVRSESRRAKEAVARSFADAGYRVLPTHPNVAILSIVSPDGNAVTALRARGVKVLPGSSFGRTHPGWDDRYARVRVVERDLVEPLRRRIAAR